MTLLVFGRRGVPVRWRGNWLLLRWSEADA